MLKKFTLKNNKMFSFLLLIECFFLFWGIIGLLKGEEILNFNTEELVMEGNFTLKPGQYIAKITYNVSNNEAKFSVDSDNKYFKNILINDVALLSESTQQLCEFYITRQLDEAYFRFENSEAAGLRIENIELTKTTKGSSILIFITCILSGVINTLYFYHKKMEKKPATKEEIFIATGLIGGVVIASIPLMVDYVFASNEMYTNLLRIQSVIESISRGDFAFHSEGIFIFIPVMFRMIGFTLTTAYQMTMVSINALTMICAYYCISRAFQNKDIGVVGGVIYTISSYRIATIYVEANMEMGFLMIGELLVFYGIFLFAKKIKEIYKEIKREIKKERQIQLFVIIIMGIAWYFLVPNILNIPGILLVIRETIFVLGICCFLKYMERTEKLFWGITMGILFVCAMLSMYQTNAILWNQPNLLRLYSWQQLAQVVSYPVEGAEFIEIIGGNIKYKHILILLLCPYFFNFLYTIYKKFTCPKASNSL